jgi:mono/diheme cytochrome c family protein
VRRAPALAAVLAAAAMLAGCGSGGGGSSAASDALSSAPLTPAELAAGREIFRDRCARCHTLADAGAHGTRGPNLDEIPLPVFAATQQVRLGGGGMPAYGRRLTDQQIREVVGYIVAKRAVGP